MLADDQKVMKLFVTNCKNVWRKIDRRVIKNTYHAKNYVFIKHDKIITMSDTGSMKQEAAGDQK